MILRIVSRKSTKHIPQNKTHEVKKTKNLHPHPIYDVNPFFTNPAAKTLLKTQKSKKEKRKKP